MFCTVTVNLRRPDGGPLAGAVVGAVVDAALIEATTDANGIATFSFASGKRVRFLCDDSRDLTGKTVIVPSNSDFFVGIFRGDASPESTSGGTAAFADITGAPSDNTALAAVLAEKADVTDLDAKLDEDLSTLDAAEAIESTDALAVTQTDITVTAPFCAGQYSYRGLAGGFFRYFNPLGESSDYNVSAILEYDNGGVFYAILDDGGSTQYISAQTIENYADIFAVDDWLDGTAEPADPQPVLTPTPTTRKVTQGLLQAAIPIRLTSRLAAPAVYNDVAAFSDSLLGVSVEAGETYDIELILYTTSVMQPLKLEFGGTASVTNFIGQWISNVASDFTAGSTSSVVTAPGTDFTATNSAEGYTTFKGTIAVNAAGTFLLRAAQESADASDTTIRSGSTLILRRIS